MQEILQIFLSLVPVLLFLLVLKIFDSFKLIKFQMILVSIAVGGLVALICFGINLFFLGPIGIDLDMYSRYDAPLIEEFFKGLFIYYLIRSNRIGFRVDGAIHGFAVGAGFAVVENIYYLQVISEASLLLWIIRGFGTAIMHGGTTAIFAIIAKGDVDQRNSTHFLSFFPGLATAMIIHAFFNHFFLPPLLMTLILLIVLPTIILFVFQQSEKSTRNWLDVGFDSDQELLDILSSDKISSSKIGIYLASLKDTYPPEVVFDIICYMRVHLELSIRAKGIMMMKEAGFDMPPDPTILPMLDELEYLEKSIGRTGKLTISPFLSTKSQDLWQLKMLAEN